MSAGCVVFGSNIYNNKELFEYENGVLINLKEQKFETILSKINHFRN